MTRMYAYVRVSTARQGQGASLTEQRSAIEDLAEKEGYLITQWFSEKESAAKRGRREFSRMVSQLRKNKADGVIFHKLDRGTRNQRDWADIGELIDDGVAIKFAHENIDVSQRGGRLTADVLAAISADYIRNLKDERDKGFYGRLKQGLYPLRAPVGYNDCGRGNLKEINLVHGPLVLTAFELYSTGKYSLETLCSEMATQGLRSRKDGYVDISGMSRILRNPFYTGILYIKTTKETFQGKHATLIPMELFESVQGVLDGNRYPRPQSHSFLFRKMIKCHLCSKSLIGELQKGRVYYRCHTKACDTKSIREDRFDFAIKEFMKNLSLTKTQYELILQRIGTSTVIDKGKELVNGLKLQLSNAEIRLERLTDAYLDEAIDKETLIRKKASLLKNIALVRDQITKQSSSFNDFEQSITEKLELLRNPWLTYKDGTQEEKREIIKKMTSNTFLCGKKPLFELKKPFEKLFHTTALPQCTGHRVDARKQDGHCVTSATLPILQDESEEVANQVFEILLEDAGQIPEVSVPVQRP